MIAFLLSLAIADDTAAMMRTAVSRLAAPCSDAACAPAPASRRYRIDGERAVTPSAKDRALGVDGTRCSVGDRICTRKPRTLFRSSFTAAAD